MPGLIPPMPNGTLPGSGYWNDWVEKLRTIVNSFAGGISWTVIINTPTTLAGYGITDGAQLVSGRVVSGVKTTDYIIQDDFSKGFVMKSPNGHYWQLSISNTGVISTTDLGTTSP